MIFLFLRIASLTTQCKQVFVWGLLQLKQPQVNNVKIYHNIHERDKERERKKNNEIIYSIIWTRIGKKRTHVNFFSPLPFTQLFLKHIIDLWTPCIVSQMHTWPLLILKPFWYICLSYIHSFTYYTYSHQLTYIHSPYVECKPLYI